MILRPGVRCDGIDAESAELVTWNGLIGKE